MTVPDGDARSSAPVAMRNRPPHPPSPSRAPGLAPWARLCSILAAAVAIIALFAVLNANAQQARPDIAVDAGSGLLTATFPDRTSDRDLAAAVADMIARGVRSIRLQGAPIHTIAPLAAISDLRQLDISGTQVRDLGPLAALTRLVTLNLQFLRIDDLSPLTGLGALRVVNAGGTEVSDLSPLSRLTDLRDLAVAVTAVTNLRPLSPLRQLVALDLSGTRVTNLSPLSTLTSLRRLSLNGTIVEDLTALADLTALQALDLAGTRVTDLTPLARLTALRTLDLEGTPVADISPLAGLTALRSVALGGSKVTDMAPLRGRTVDPRVALTQQRPPDPVLYWNQQTNRTVQVTKTDAFVASRALALESIAVLDTLRSIDALPAFLVRLPAPPDAEAPIAAAAAAHTMLGLLFPDQRAALDAAFATYLAAEAPSIARQRSIAFGDAVAEAVFMRQAGDDPTGAVPRPADGGAGHWRPTPPDYLAPAHPEWAVMRPFAMTNPAQFRPPGPPALDSAAFHDAKAAVAAIGARQSSVRTPEQTQIAQYWSDAIGSYAPSGHWDAIMAEIMAPMHLGLDVEALRFAELNVALADAGVAIADAKYTYWFWRPVTAIRAGDGTDPPDPDWEPLLETPNHPSYISGHSAFSAAAAAVLTARFGDRRFSFASDSLPGVTRAFSGFAQAAQEAASSRLYGGIHYSFDNADGLATGQAVGAWVLQVFDQQADDRGPFLMVEADPVSHAVIGCALDNLSPLTQVVARVDGALPFNLPVDEKGWFKLPPLRPGRVHSHAIVVAARSQSGRVGSARLVVQGEDPDAAAPSSGKAHQP